MEMIWRVSVTKEDNDAWPQLCFESFAELLSLGGDSAPLGTKGSLVA